MGARRTHPVKLIVSCLRLGLMLALAVTVLSLGSLLAAVVIGLERRPRRA